MDDQRLQSELLKFGEANLAAGRAVKAADIRAQFDRRRCRLALAPLAQRGNTISTAAAGVRPGVAIVGGIYKCTKCSNWHLGTASGFFISSDGILVTNHHVVAAADRETFVVMSGDGRMKLFAEARYLDVDTPAVVSSPNGLGTTTVAASTKLIPISLGVRW